VNLGDRRADISAGAAPGPQHDVVAVVRRRDRSGRAEALAARTNLSPSTISRVDTGKRTISLDILLPLAAALQVDLDALLAVRSDDDVVIRPTPTSSGRAHNLAAEEFVVTRPASAG
jgi:transcriptional regulator with XRE-family HTH domain